MFGRISPLDKVHHIRTGIGGRMVEVSHIVESMECDHTARRKAWNTRYADTQTGIVILHKGHMARNIFENIWSGHIGRHRAPCMADTESPRGILLRRYGHMWNTDGHTFACISHDLP